MNEKGEEQAPVTTRRHVEIEIFALCIFALFVTVVLWAGRESSALGIADKTLWDWLDLLIVPAVLAAIALLFQRSEKERERETEGARCKQERDLADAQRTEDRKLADRARKKEQWIAEDNQRERALQEYFAGMKELLLTHGLRTSEAGAEVRSVAHAQTHAVLRRLDGERRTSIFKFLRDANLLDIKSPIISLYHANLEEADLSWDDLSSINLGGARLFRANLSQSFLFNTKFIASDLRYANLSGVECDGTIFEYAVLEYADLTRADLADATFAYAFLKGANLSRAYLGEADLRGARHILDANFEGRNFPM